jgi:hypothetical protein
MEGTMRLVQLTLAGGGRAVAAAVDGGPPRLVLGAASVRALAAFAIAGGVGLTEAAASHGFGAEVDLETALAEGRVLPPVDHPDPAHLLVTGTGLTHLGSAESRDRMHRELADPAKLTDSMRMFRLGLDGGKPAGGQVGAQPEWFYKGDGSSLVAPEAPLPSPAFALDGGEEPEIVGLYLIGPDGTPHRLGFALGNEFSDHVTERANYLYLAHSKLRPCAIGPELHVGALPDEVRGTARIRRGEAVVWEKPFLSGEAHMCHSLSNLEHHHFKYGLFRRPGDLHAHFFGTATLSFSDGVQTRPGDVFEIEADLFTLPLRNAFAVESKPAPAVRVL